MGRFWKLLGNLAVRVLAMAEAFRMAKGSFPVMEFPLPEPLTKLLVPLVLVVLEIPFYPGLLLFEFGCCPFPPKLNI